MKTRLIFLTLLSTLPILLIAAGTMIAATMQIDTEKKSDPDKTLSPYFFVKSDNPNLDQLPLKATSAEVNIAGVIDYR
jgi:Ca-activated chloride channel family protein